MTKGTKKIDLPCVILQAKTEIINVNVTTNLVKKLKIKPLTLSIFIQFAQKIKNVMKNKNVIK